MSRRSDVRDLARAMYPGASITDISNVSFNADESVAFVEGVLTVPMLPPGIQISPPHEAAAEAEGVRRFLSGEQIQCSSGVDESITYGYGGLSRLGYWQYPVPAALVEMRRALRDARELMQEDPAGQPLASLLRDAADVIAALGGGPLVERLRIQGGRIDGFFVEHPTT